MRFKAWHHSWGESMPHLVDVVVSYDGIKDSVEVVEQIDHLDGLAVGWDGGEADDVAEVNRHTVKMLRFDGPAHLQSLGHGPEEGRKHISACFKLQVSPRWCVSSSLTHGGSICVSSFSVFCFSISSSSVRSLISSSRLDEYCSSILSMESIMLVFFPLLMFLNWEDRKDEETGSTQVFFYRLSTVKATQPNNYDQVFSIKRPTWSKISSKLGLLSGCSVQHCFISWMHSNGAQSWLTTGRHRGGGLRSFSIISKTQRNISCHNWN